MRTTFWRWLLLAFLVGSLAGCPTAPTDSTLPAPVGATNHRWFPIGAGTNHEFGKASAAVPMGCDSCHPADAPSFTEFQCVNCHKHPTAITDRLHHGVTDAGVDFVRSSAGCYQCHSAGESGPFSHTGVTSQCAECHQVGNAFAALPKDNFTHPEVGTTDCGACHVTTTWKSSSAAPSDVADPAKSRSVLGLVPTFAGPSITRVTPLQQLLPMPMNHLATALSSDVASTCNACHADGNTGIYFPGLMHSSLANLGVAQPSRCAECHSRSQPEGFVGPLATAPARTPASGEMRHEAVAWANGMPTTTKLVPVECALCHQTPDSTLNSNWSTGLQDAGTPQFHSSLTAASQPQPGSCLDCHANSRPVALLTSSNAALPAGMTFDHGGALGDCGSCHLSTTRWSGGKFHLAAAASPTTCLPCHAQQRPTSTSSWASTTYSRSPFDYVTNAAGIPHGGGEDCAVCHVGPGTGAWGGTQNWQAGHFPHGPGTLAATSCSACHLTQRPTVEVGPPGALFNHTLNGMGDCRACHQATVTAGRYVDYFNPVTMTLPGGDWKGGKEYPGDVVITSPTQFIALTQYSLQRATPQGLVTGITSQNTTIFNAMLHTSTAVPTRISPGPTNMPNDASCWHCHTHTAGTVTSYADGRYHSSLTTFAPTPGGVVAAIPQPTTGCIDCHEAMRPNLIVQKAGSVLQPMDHSARFTTTVMIGGKPTISVSTIDCSTCHRSPGNRWDDGRFHANISSAVPADCVSCHYPLMATATADVTSGATFQMKHRSTQLSFQGCERCHATALAASTTLPLAATLWRTGGLHANTTPQPTSCLECHSASEPTSATQSFVTWAFATGGTTTNGRMWMRHTVAAVTSRDCGACHASDAKTTGSAWSDSTSFHGVVTNPGACAACHGTSNGRGTVIGTNNNLPVGLINSRTTTTASTAPSVKDQLSHGDLNVTNHDCAFCHTQVGRSTTPGVQGQEWKQARFHQNFNAANPLVMNLTTGRCSTCHFNLKPGPTFAAFDHSSYTNTSGTPDCSSCHSWPGTSTTTPNWLGAAAMPAFIAVGGFTIPMPPASAANTVQRGISNLPHPTVGVGVACTTCHVLASGGRRATGYDHRSALINSNCNSCHEVGSDLTAVAWSTSTRGDTRPTATVTIKGRACSPIHFYPTDCKECHRVPSSGNGNWVSASAALASWKFSHSRGSPMTQPGTCNKCHNSTASGGCGIPD